MISTLITSIVALLMALALFVSTFREGVVADWAINLAWVGLVATFGLIYAELLPGGAAALCAAAFAAMAAFPTGVAHGKARVGAMGAGGAIALMVALGAAIFAANTYYDEVAKDPNLILLAGQWSALSAAITSAVAACGAGMWRRDGRAVPIAAALAIAAMLAGALTMGNLRPEIPQPGYAVELVSDGQPLRWALPGITPDALAFGFHVTLPVPAVDVLLALAILAALASAIAAFVRRDAIASWAMAAAGVSGAGGAGAILYTGFHAALPEVDRYLEYARSLGAEKKIPGRLIELGSFDVGASIYVLWIDILPDLMLIGGAALLALALAWMMREGATFPYREDDVLRRETEALDVARTAPRHWRAVASLWARDLGARAAALGWLGWVLTSLLVWRTHATYGFSTPQEWVMLGALIASTGLAMVAWRDDIWRPLAHGGIAAAIVMAVVVMGLG